MRLRIPSSLISLPEIRRDLVIRARAPLSLHPIPIRAPMAQCTQHQRPLLTEHRCRMPVLRQVLLAATTLMLRQDAQCLVRPHQHHRERVGHYNFSSAQGHLSASLANTNNIRFKSSPFLRIEQSVSSVQECPGMFPLVDILNTLTCHFCPKNQQEMRIERRPSCNSL